ncbi:PTPLA-domain-containing protein [Dentipellis sp. KUC8613]|nr:PTPLA-domain-containing protein [Dentipellis sp. KUC8613]
MSSDTKTKTLSDGSKKKATPVPVQAYLIFYNLLSAAGWSYVLLLTVDHLFPGALPFAVPKPASSGPTLLERLTHPTFTPSYIPDALAPVYKRATTTYAAVGEVTAYVQTAAVLEVLHVLFGFVRSPLPTTAMQVASRLFLVWGVAARYDAARTTPLYASMVLSWSITEVIRYAFYTLALLGSEPALLSWLRYTTFYVLYPTGAGSEAFVNFATLPSFSNLGAWDVEAYVRAALFAIWWPGLYVMYTHMMRQRRKVFGGAGRTLGAKPKSS